MQQRQDAVRFFCISSLRLIRFGSREMRCIPPRFAFHLCGWFVSGSREMRWFHYILRLIGHALHFIFAADSLVDRGRWDFCCLGRGFFCISSLRLIRIGSREMRCILPCQVCISSLRLIREWIAGDEMMFCLSVFTLHCILRLMAAAAAGGGLCTRCGGGTVFAAQWLRGKLLGIFRCFGRFFDVWDVLTCFGSFSNVSMDVWRHLGRFDLFLFFFGHFEF